MNIFILGIIIFAFTYVLIISDKIPHTLSAMLGGILMIGLGIINKEKAYKAIDLEVIFLLIGMMIIVHIMSETGFFQWIAIKTAQFVKGEPFLLMGILAVVTAVLSAFLDNVTTIMLIVPVTILLAEQIEQDCIPYLIAEITASNIGGTATLIGDPPNILIASSAKLTFNEFLINLAPIVFINIIVLVITIWFLFGRKMKVSRDVKARIMELDASRALKDIPLLKKTGGVIILVIIGFLTHNLTNIEPSVIAIGGAVLLMIIAKQNPEEALKHVEWKTIFFFIGLFMMVEGIVEIGAIKILAEKALSFTGGDFKVTSILILWISGIFSAFVDNIPYTATMIPMIGGEGGLIESLYKANPEIGFETVRYALWWSLSLGACLGGNGTLIGASANVVAAGVAAKSGKKLSFMRFTKYGFFIMLQSMVISTVYVWIRYLR
jgi:Na+/H+ antiporter NhaD/arsenite permease-like protein